MISCRLQSVISYLTNWKERNNFMEDTKTSILKKPGMKNEDEIRKMHMYKDAAVNAMKDSLEFDKKIVESNDDYIKKLREADATEYDILKANMEKAETAEERAAIRERLAEMNVQRHAKDTENKEFYEKQQENHRNHDLKILTSVAVITGLAYKFRKPIMNAGKALIKKV